MTKSVVALLSVASLGFAGCGAVIQGKPMGAGSIYSDVQFNEAVVAQASAGAKQGESCATSILGLVATGDASALSAAKKAGITKIATVDGTHSNILGLFGKYCVVVSGE